MIRRRTTLILALLAAALAVVIRVWEWEDDSDKLRIAAARSAFRFDPARATALAIRTDTYDILCERHGSQWVMQTPFQARADAAAIERLLGTLSEIPRGEMVLPAAAEADLYAPYGLDMPRARIWIAIGAQTNALLIGRRSPLGDGVYVRREGVEGIARTSGAILSRLPNTPADLRSRILLTGAPGAVSRLEIRGPYGYIQLVRTDAGFWRILQPVSARADAIAVARILDALFACSISQFAQDNVTDFTPYGLRDDSTVTAIVNTDRAAANQILAFSEPLPGATNLVYARLQAENSVYSVPRAARDALLQRPEALRARDLPPVTAENLSAIRLEEGGSAITFEKEPGTTAWQITSPMRAEVNPAALLSIATAWNTSAISTFASNIQTTYPRIITLRQETPAGTLIHTLHLAPEGTNTLAQLEGDSTPFHLNGRALLDLPLDPLFYRTRDVFTIPEADIASVSISTAGLDQPPIRYTPGGAEPPPAWWTNFVHALAPLQADAILETDFMAPGQPASGANVITIRQRGKTALQTTLTLEPAAKGRPQTAYLLGHSIRFTLPPSTTAALRAPTAPPP